MKHRFSFNSQNMIGIAASCGSLVLAGVLAGSPLAAQAQATGPIEIGMVFPKQGPSASLGEYLSRGALLAIEQHGKVKGRDINVTYLDEADAQTAQQNFQKLVDEHKVVAVVGGNSSAAAMAMMGVAARTKTPLIAPGAAAREITGSNCNRYTFRFQATVPVQMKGLMPFIEKAGKKTYFITAAYNFGQDILKAGQDLLSASGGTQIGVDEVPLNTADYSSYVLKIRSAKPDVVVGGLVGQDLSNFLKQWTGMNMKEKVPFFEIAVSDTDFWNVGPKVAAGTYAKPWYYNDPSNSEAENQFTKAFTDKYGKPPSDKAYSGWISMRSLLESLEKSESTDSKDIVIALEKWKDEKGSFPAFYREWDHQMIRPFFVGTIKANITDQWDYFDMIGHSTTTVEETLADYGTKEEVGCNMPSL